MLNGYKIVPFIPAGRKRQMSVLIDNLRRFSEIDEVQIWVNVEADGSQADDEKWLRSLPGQWDKCKIYDLPEGLEHKTPKQLNTGKFYTYTQANRTMYFRMDDDLCYIDDDYFKNMVRCRVDNPEPPIICGNIWNNAICSYLQQHEGRIDKEHGVVESLYCMDPVGWNSAPFAEYIHRVFLKHLADGTVTELYFKNFTLENTRFSVSNFCFTGTQMRKMKPGMIDDEEVWLTERYPQKVGIPNIICGDAMVSHYSFFTQRPLLDKTDILEQYRKVARGKLSGDYYKLLGEHPSYAPQNGHNHQLDEQTRKELTNELLDKFVEIVRRSEREVRPIYQVIQDINAMRPR